MKKLEERILRDGQVLGENILKVDSFLTHQVDFSLMKEIGQVFAEAVKDAGITEDVIRELGREIPIFGICLGHQAIGEVFGGRIVRANEIIHGKASPIRHCATGIYHGIADGTLVARYHSLIIERESLPNTLEITSELDNGIIMGVRHHVFPIEGIQFHPESILTPDGQTMMTNYLKGIHAI